MKLFVALFLAASVALVGCDQKKSEKGTIAPAGFKPMTLNIESEPLKELSGLDNSYTPESKMVLNAITEAGANGKLVLLKIAAGWCGPCMSLDDEIEANQEEFDKILEGFEYVSLEEMQWHALPGNMDFMNVQGMAYFPSLFIINPETGRWAYLAESDYAGVKEAIAQYQADGGLATNRIKKIREIWEDEEFSFLKEDEHTPLLKDTIMSAAYESNSIEYKNFMLDLRNKMAEFPEKFNDEDGNSAADYEIQRANQFAAARGLLTADEAYMLSIKTVSALHSSLFEGAAAAINAANPGNAFDACVAKYDEFAAHEEVLKLVDAEKEAAFEKSDAIIESEESSEEAKAAAEASKEDASSYWSYILMRSKQVCLMIGQREGSVSATDVIDFHQAGLDAGWNSSRTTRFEEGMSFMHALAGNFDRAIEINKIRRETDAATYQGYYDEYEGLLNTAKTDLEAAQAERNAETDEAKIEEIDAKIDGLKATIASYEELLPRIIRIKDRIEKALADLQTAWENGTTEVKKEK